MSKVKIKTLIVDDERLARRLIRTLLATEDDFEILAECEDGDQAIRAIESLQPDLVFLDVQMPEIDGFDVIKALDEEILPTVVFVTAYDQYAVRAFEVHALDYLLKPFDDERFLHTLNRVRTLIERRRMGQAQVNLLDLVENVKQGKPAAERMMIKSAGRITFIEQDKIDWVEASGNYMRIHVGKDIHLVRETMASMEQQLDRNRFVRIHRSTIVNLDRIKEMKPSWKGSFEVTLQKGDKLTLSRRYRQQFEEKLGRKLG